MRSDKANFSAHTYIGRFCAIDIGTVTCRMLISDAFAAKDGTIILDELSKQYEIVNLGEGVDSTHRLSQEALKRTENVLRRYLEIRDSFNSEESPVSVTSAIATSASRDAENSSDFTEMMASLGLKLDVISGAQEANLSFTGASRSYPGEAVVVVDVGGGSTEISAGIGGENLTYSHSFDIGSRRMTERFWDGYPCSKDQIDAARFWAQEVFQSIPDDIDCERMIAVAGTATSVVTIDLGMWEYDASIVNGTMIDLHKLEDIEHGLAKLDLMGLENVVGLDPKRAPVIVAGIVILEEAMKALSASIYTASESDILEGIVMYNATQYMTSH